TVYGIVVQSSGYIWVDSELGKGTTFKICLPRVEPEDSLPQAPASPAGSPRGSEKILLVEDEDAVRGVASRVLRNQGYTVIQARNGEEALKQLEELGGAVDLILTDVIMPDLGGPALAEQLRSRWPNVKLIYMSGYAQDDKLQPELQELEGSFLQKPFSTENLVLKVREVLDSKPERSR
ncbi:MAG TPA: response regulator, partial [Gemmatimonadales bacterium]|nr:response regulator [Gemmatimonadales bacterium]